MRYGLIVAALMFSAAIAKGQVEVQPIAPQYENYIQVTGNAEREIVPDEIFVRIIINENDTKGKTSVEQAERQMIAKLKSIGIDTDTNLKVGDMASELKTAFLAKNSARTTATYQLKVNSAAQLGSVYQALESIGISNMKVTKLNHSKLEQLKNEVRIEALKNAQTQAQQMAEALGQKAGRAVYIVDYNNGYLNTSNNVMQDTYLRAASSEANTYETELNFREIKLTYSLTAKFVLE